MNAKKPATFDDAIDSVEKEIGLNALNFQVSGDPKGQPRPRAFARKFGQKWSARVYDPGTAEHWKSAIAAAFKQHAPDWQMMTGPVDLELHFVFRRPKSHHRSNGELKPSAPMWHVSKPDADNAAKCVCDALTQIGAWNDDAQVARLLVTKRYTVGGFVGCVVQIKEATL